MEIKIVEYDPIYQLRIDTMMLGIQAEFAEAITSKHSTVISEVYQQDDQKFWIALFGEELAGTIGIRFFAKGKAEIKRMMVANVYRGKIYGTATLLMRKALELAKERDVKEIYLGTMQQFIAAQKFYEHYGYALISQKDLPIEYQINPMDTLFYRMKL